MILLGIASLLLLLCVWLGYPLVIGALASRRRPVAGAPWDAEPTVSVVIATRDPLPVVVERVANCLHCEYASLREIVVGLDAAQSYSSAEVATLLQLDARVRVVRGDEPGGKASTVNAAVRACSGRVLVFADAHQSFATDALQRLAAALADPSIGAVSGSLHLPARAGGRSPVELYWNLERWLREREARLHSTVGVTGAIYALRRSLWAPLPAGLILDDVYVPMRVVLSGHRVGFCSDAVAYETRRVSTQQEYRRKVRTLAGNLQLCAWLPAVLLPGRNPVWAQFVFHKLLRLLTPYAVLGVLLAAASSIPRVLTPGAARVGLLIAAGLLLALTTRPRLARRLGSALVQTASLQAATVVGTLYGLRGRWDVWSQ